MSRAFIKETDPDVLDALREAEIRQNKVEWLQIQEKKLARLIEKCENKSCNKSAEQSAQVKRWISDLKKNIANVKKELGYSE